MEAKAPLVHVPCDVLMLSCQSSCLLNPSGFYVEEVKSGARGLLEVEEMCKIPVSVFNFSFIFANFLQDNL